MQVLTRLLQYISVVWAHVVFQAQVSVLTVLQVGTQLKYLPKIVTTTNSGQGLLRSSFEAWRFMRSI
jgi:hypothetical protein